VFEQTGNRECATLRPDCIEIDHTTGVSLRTARIAIWNE
jgi:hypothetical protein